jgi:transposase
MGLGYVEGVTHDYVRNGTTTLFAALDIATGAVLTECKPRHRHREFLSFLRRIDEAVPATLKHAKVRAWLASRPRFQLHFTPTYSSWLNQVETLVRTDHPAGHPPRLIQERQGSDRQNQPFRPALQSHLQALRLDCHRRLDLR